MNTERGTAPERAFLWSGNPQLDPGSSFAADVQRGHVFHLRLHAESHVSAYTENQRVQNKPGTDEPLQWGSDDRGLAEPCAVPAELQGSKGHAYVRRLAQLCLARHASSQAGQGRLLAYKPALKQRAELQVSGSEQLRCVTTGQLSHGNRLLSCTVPAKAGANTPSHKCARGREHAGSLLPRLS